MLPGTIAMLLFIVIVVFGGAIYLVSLNLKSSPQPQPEGEEPSVVEQ